MATSCTSHTARAARVRAFAAGIAAAASLLGSHVLAPDAAAATTVKPAYGWPVKPFHQQHPVRGYFGDPRIGMTPKGIQHRFHFGIDISCPNGTPVYATLDGVVRLESFRPETVAIIGRDGHTAFEYWHIKPAVSNGQRVLAHRTLVGWAQAPWEHVHFSEVRDGVYVNPLRPGALGPFVDRTRPWVKQLRASTGRTARGLVDLVVEAYDETPIAVPGRWGGKPVTPALLRWRVTSAAGRVVKDWRTAIDHRLTEPEDAAFSSVYARWTRQNKRNRPGRYRFVLATGWDTRALADDRYVVEVAAADASGNAVVERFSIRVANRVSGALAAASTVRSPREGGGEQ